jgi:hypothetical protein
MSKNVERWFVAYFEGDDIEVDGGIILRTKGNDLIADDLNRRLPTMEYGKYDVCEVNEAEAMRIVALPSMTATVI